MIALLLACTPGNDDWDGDGLLDAEEDRLGTSPDDPDTDSDGLSDGDEVHGLAGWDSDPLQRDLFVEMDAVAIPDGRSAVLSDAARAWLVDFFADTDIRLHLVDSDVYEDDFDCYADNRPSDLPEQWFHHLELCLREPGARLFRGISHGRRVSVAGLPALDGPEDDWHERRQWRWAALTAHEIGHSIGLSHGGHDSLNFKPNYPSLMNYRYLADGYDGSRRHLADTEVQWSDGGHAPLDEAALDECGSLTGDLSFLTHGDEGFDVDGDCVDWNRNGVFDDEPVEADIDGNGELDVLEDANDYALIEVGAAL